MRTSPFSGSFRSSLSSSAPSATPVMLVRVNWMLAGAGVNTSGARVVILKGAVLPWLKTLRSSSMVPMDVRPRAGVPSFNAAMTTCALAAGAALRWGTRDEPS